MIFNTSDVKHKMALGLCPHYCNKIQNIIVNSNIQEL